jgi:hypothetical protein
MVKISKIAEISEIRKSKDSGKIPANTKIKEYKVSLFGTYKDNDGIIHSPHSPINMYLKRF